MSFATPAAPSSGIKWESHKGALLVIEPISFEAGIQTSFGNADAVKATVHVIDGPGAGESFDEALVFPKLLASQLKSQIGQKVLGRLGQGQAKPGQSAPWLLQPASPDDVTRAEQWVAKQASQFSAPASSAAPF